MEGSRGAGSAIVEKLDDQPKDVFPLRRVGRAALEDGPDSRSELRDFVKKIKIK